MSQAPASKEAPLVQIDGVTLSFGGVIALSGVSFDIPEGIILGLIGPNGAGKTSLFNCLSRIYTPQAGDIRLNGSSVLARRPHELAGLGLSRGFQNLALFPRLCVLDNILIGGHSAPAPGLLADIARVPSARNCEHRARERAADIAERLDLSPYLDKPAGVLSFGLQKRVEVARALMASPKLLMLDEPAGGLNHGDVAGLGTLIRDLRDEWDLTILLVEHHMGLVMSVADRVVVLDFGEVLAQGSPQEVQNDPKVIAAYLGTGSERVH